MIENVIELKGLTKRYGYGDTESFALKDFNLTIKHGEFIMIMGPSGCGKTTLLNMIGLLDRSTSGEYILNGENEVISNYLKARMKDRLDKGEQIMLFVSSKPVCSDVSFCQSRISISTHPHTDIGAALCLLGIR